MSSRYNVIIVGAGLNGLVAAAYLAKAGKRVLVLERRSIVGGSYATEEFHPGFRADAGPVGWLNPTIARDLGIKTRIHTSNPAVCAPQPDGNALILDVDPVEAAAAIRRFSPADADRWPAFCAPMARLAAFLETVYASPPPRGVELTFGEFLPLAALGMKLRRLGRRDMLALIQSMPMTIQELLDNWFESEHLKGALAASGIRNLMQGPMASGTGYLFLHHQVGLPAGNIGGRRWIAGGAGQLVDTVSNIIHRAGGEVRTDAEVTRLTIRDGRATGVILTSGQEIEGYHIVSSLDPKTTFFSLADPYHLDLDFTRKVRGIRTRGAAARLHLALDGLPDFGTDPVNLQGRIVISPSIDYLEHAYDAAKYGGLSEHPYLEVSLPTLSDPSLAPPGQHVMTIHIQYVPYHLKGGWDKTQRTKLAQQTLDTLSAYAADLGDRILGQELMTPVDLEQVYGWPEGNPYHVEMALDQILFMRPVAGWSQTLTPLEGLYLCGSGNHPGGGIAGGVGYLAAQHIKKHG